MGALGEPGIQSARARVWVASAPSWAQPLPARVPALCQGEEAGLAQPLGIVLMHCRIVSGSMQCMNNKPNSDRGCLVFLGGRKTVECNLWTKKPVFP